MFGFEIRYKGRTIEVGIPGGSILLYAGLLSRDAPQIYPTDLHLW